jgi:DDE superfamily endonuclease
MLTLPAELLALLGAFAPLFSRPVWEHAQVLLVGAMLATGKRTVTACLRVMGLSHETRFVNYHRVLNRARWSTLTASHILLRLLVMTFAPQGTLVFGLDDTIERRRGDHITAKGIYRDPVRSSHTHFVKASGLRWLCCMVLVHVPWAGTTWGLPVLTALCPSERYHTERGRKHQPLTDRAWHIIQVVRRWLPTRTLVFVAASSFAVLDLLGTVSRTPRVSLITRLRLDAELWAPAPERHEGQKGRPRVQGARRPSPQQRLDDAKTVWTKREVEGWYGGGTREVEVYSEICMWYKSGHQPVLMRWVLVRDPQGELEPQAFLSTDPAHPPVQILTWFVQRWRMEVTFEEARAHLGLETQRQWSDVAIARTTPVLFGLFSLVTLLADGLIKNQVKATRSAAWYTKARPTFADAIAVVRRCLWSRCHFSTSGQSNDVVKIPRSLFERLTDAVCYAA